MTEEIGAAILAGGLSRRMGENKALLRITEGGPAIIEMVVMRLAEVGLTSPLLVTNTPEEYSFVGLECVPDDIQGAGALGGILTAINHSRHSRVLVVACDMPLLNVELLRYMMSARADYAALIPRWRDEERIRVEPLHAIYSVKCARMIDQRIAEGKLKVSRFLSEINARYLDEDEMRLYDPELQSFFNVNTPEDWEAIKQIQAHL